MVANRGGFFKDHDTQFMLLFCSKLHQPAGGCQAGGACTDDNNIHFHGFALNRVRGLSHIDFSALFRIVNIIPPIQNHLVSRYLRTDSFTGTSLSSSGGDD